MSEPRPPSALGRFIRRLTQAIAVCAIALAAVFAYLMYPVWRSYPAAAFSPAASEAERNRQDLEYLSRLPEFDRSFSKEKRRAFARAIERLIQQSDIFDRAKLTLEAARLTALSDNGHTNVLTQLGDASFRSVPIRLGVFSDGLYVIKAKDENRDLIGAQLLAVNERPVDSVSTAFRPYLGGPPTLLRQHLPRLVVSPELLMAAGLSGRADSSEYRFRLANGTVIDRLLSAPDVPPKVEDNPYWPVRDLSPIPTLTDGPGWSHVLDVAPLYLSRLDENYWHAFIDDGRVLFLQINRMRDQGRQRLADFLAEELDAIKRRGTKFVVVDLRYNRGGDYTQAADFSRRLVDAMPPDGRIFILTGGNTFSAAISTVSRIRYFAGARATQVGEPMGDRGHFWGEGDRIVLPNSKIVVRYATAYHDWENGCGLDQITTCFLFNYIYGAAPGDLTPQLVASPRFAYYASGRDMVMDEVMKVIRSTAVVSALGKGAGSPPSQPN
ncbi:MAG: S41 family peptidase [Parvibaculaceae bacterium]